ncbi:MAG: gliding motility lipoprotein GldB [Flavobacterium sp.]
MKKLLILTLLSIAFFSCDKKSKIEKQVEEIPANLKVERFDKVFFETPSSQLPQLKKKFPQFFPTDVPDNVWTEKMANPLWRELYTEVQKEFGDFKTEKKEIEDFYKHAKFYFPKTKTPKIYTLIYEMDYNYKAIYADSIVLISLEMYLGKDHKFYEYPAYLKQNFEKRQMMPDLASSFASSKIPPPSDKTLLSQMIYAGKELYLKDLLLPNYTDAEKIGYKPEQITWCNENEAYMWSYFIEDKILYSTDSRLPNRFINIAPFSKFYLEIDNESPGKVGTWVGWQIVRSFMKNNDVPLQKMLMMNADEIFNKSKYKPKKNE